MSSNSDAHVPIEGRCWAMREVLPGRLWIGNAGDARDPERLLRAGVVAVMNLAAEEPSPVLPRSMVFCRFPIMDGDQGGLAILDVAIRTLVSLLENRIPTLVYCGAGMSRSPAVVAAALSIVDGASPEDVGSHRCPVLRPGYESVASKTRKRRNPIGFCDGVDSPLLGERIPAAPRQLDASP